MAIPSSIRDLAPIVEGGTAAGALQNTLDFARHAERFGHHRYWLAEHHNMPGIASAATAVLIAPVAGGTRTIRVGSGGIMLPNHAPLIVAEHIAGTQVHPNFAPRSHDVRPATPTASTGETNPLLCVAVDPQSPIQEHS
jgi:hypothetical protein